MFEVGDIVRIKPEKRKFIRELYSRMLWDIKKQALGYKAAEGIKLIVKQPSVSKISGVTVTDLENKYYVTLNLQEDNFELVEKMIEKQAEVDESAMFALL